MSIESKRYLGDGVYAEFDGWVIKLTTENGIEETSRIILEPDVTNSLIRFIEDLKQSLKALKL